jgi:chemotaxis protein methyltransferase CheR
MQVSQCPSFAEFRFEIQNNDIFFEQFLEEVTVNVTEMFRDPEFYKTLREKVLPHLSTFPFIRIWHAGCSTGEEVYSLAIILKEEGLLNRSLLYATDINQGVLEVAKLGKFPISQIQQYTDNYFKAGGIGELSEYYTANYDSVMFNKQLNKRMVFSVHNLVADQSFNEFNLILCRNVMIYFNSKLQNKVVKLFTDSLSPFGFLSLGNKELINFTDSFKYFTQVDQKMKIWKKKE